MRSRLITIAAASMVAVALPGTSVARDAATATLAAAAKDEKGKEEKVCKWIPKSQSRMTERVCLTKAEWKQIEKDSY